MTLEALRVLCLSLPGATEDIKWGQDLAFSVGARMFCVVNTEPPHQLAFKTTPEEFAELLERPGIRPAPYLARAMWVQEEQLGETLNRAEIDRLVRISYALVRSKLPKRARRARKSAGNRDRARSGQAAVRRHRR